jgi:hypothetical protein
MAQSRRRSVCASRIRGGALSSDPRADRGTGFWRVAATGAGRAARLRGRGPEGQKWPGVLKRPKSGTTKIKGSAYHNIDISKLFTRISADF